MGRGAESRALEPLGHKHRIISATANRRKIAPTCTTFRCSRVILAAIQFAKTTSTGRAAGSRRGVN